MSRPCCSMRCRRRCRGASLRGRRGRGRSSGLGCRSRRRGGRGCCRGRGFGRCRGCGRLRASLRIRGGLGGCLCISRIPILHTLVPFARAALGRCVGIAAVLAQPGAARRCAGRGLGKRDATECARRQHDADAREFHVIDSIEAAMGAAKVGRSRLRYDRPRCCGRILDLRGAHCSAPPISAPLAPAGGPMCCAVRSTARDRPWRVAHRARRCGR